MGFLRPELLLLALPVAWLVWRVRDRGRAGTLVRAVVGILLVLALAAPYLETAATGRDLLVVVDRSRSMPGNAEGAAEELIRLATEARQNGDRVGVVTFGSGAAIEALPSADTTSRPFLRPVDPDGSNLAEGLETALNLIPEDRHGSLVLLSDGESNAADPLSIARRAFARGVRIDVRSFPRPELPDLSVEALDLPDRVSPGEPFQFTAWVRADARVEADYVLEREGEVLASGRRTFEPGMQRLLFRDVLYATGVARYDLTLTLEGDRILENNRGLGALDVTGERPLLVLNTDGADSLLTRTLRDAALPVQIADPRSFPLDPVRLTAFRAVVLENVPARALGPQGLEALSDFVLERGGGLLMTGGKAAFGVGGYHLTPVDELLPVSMELRQEHRKQGVALVVVMDRSGSMGAGVSAGLTKMDLANRGAAEALSLLSPIDSIGVIAVDSSDHVIQPLVRVEDPESLKRRILTIRSGGGGIFVYTGLYAAARMLESAPQVNRHIILFSDAADSEEPERVPELVTRLGKMGTSVSVIALGTERDVDADFLKQIGRLGGGEVYFTTDPTTLPLLFAKDTMTIARSTFLEEPTAVRALPDLFGLGEVSTSAFPALGGYNLNYLRPGAILGAVTEDEYRAPALAFWYQGLGRTAAYTGQVGGTFGQGLARWEGTASLFVTLARWLVGQEEPTALFPAVRRDGSEAVISIEVDPEAPTAPDTSQLVARLRAPDGEYREQRLERVDEYRYEVRVPLREAGVTLGTVRLGGDRFVTLPPVTLPYSPEYERPSDPEAARRLMRELAAESGGQVDVAAHALFRGPRRSRGHRTITFELVLLALLLFLLEVAFRRLALWASVGRLLEAAPRAGTTTTEEPRPTRRAPAPDSAQEIPTAAPSPATPPPAGSVEDALTRARRRAGRRLDR